MKSASAPTFGVQLTVICILEDLHQGFPSFFRFQELVQGEGRQLRGLQLGCTSSTCIKKRSESHLIQLNDFEVLRWWFHILEELCNTPLHGGNTASECWGSCNPGLVSSHLDLLLTKLVFSILVAHCQDCIRHQDQTLEVGLVCNPDWRWMGVNSVGNDPTPHLSDIYDGKEKGHQLNMHILWSVWKGKMRRQDKLKGMFTDNT